MAAFDEEPFPPPGVDLEHPSVARVYDYYLGGTTNWAIDRQFGDRVLEAFPMLRPIAIANRMFLHKVVRHLIGLGVRQFIDIGSGVPTMGHAHEVAEEIAPGEVSVVYIDYEPVAVAHSRSLLKENGDPKRHHVIHADLRDPDGLWAKVRETGVIDLDQPVALLLIAVFHVQQPPAENSASTDDLGPAVAARYRELLPPDSYLAISHITDEDVAPGYDEKLVKLKQMYDKSSSPVIWRSRDEIEKLFGDFALIEPGVTWTTLWHPEASRENSQRLDFKSPNESVILAGVGKKP